MIVWVNGAFGAGKTVTTVRLDHDEVVEAVAAAAGLTLARPRLPHRRAALRRLGTRAGAVRLHR